MVLVENGTVISNLFNAVGILEIAYQKIIYCIGINFRSLVDSYRNQKVVKNELQVYDCDYGSVELLIGLSLSWRAPST